MTALFDSQAITLTQNRQIYHGCLSKLEASSFLAPGWLTKLLDRKFFTSDWFAKLLDIKISLSWLAHQIVRQFLASD